jgi:acetate---CoA ligase (ADP-forming)
MSATEVFKASDGGRPDLDRFFHPRGVAIVGAIDTSAFGRERIRRYGCPTCYVNPKGGDAGDIPVYKSLAEVPDPLDLVIIKISAPRAIEVMEEVGKRGVPNALVFTAGFAEVGGEGVALEHKLAAVIKKYGIRAIGPNTNENAFEPMPVSPDHRGGLIGLITQSGHNGRPVVQGVGIGAGFSRWVPLGNEVDLEASDMIEYFAYDPRTAVVAGYIEGFKSVPRLRRALEAIERTGKPFVVLKIGATEQGARMASSHTGHLTGSDAVVNGLFAQHGVTRVRDLDELLETSNLFAKLPPNTGRRTALYSISGGSGTLMAEMAELHGVPIAKLEQTTQDRLHQFIPKYLDVTNPIDNGGAFLVSAPEADRIAVMQAIVEDPNVDMLIIGITGAFALMTDNFGADILKWAASSPKPVIVTWNSVKIDEKGWVDVVRSGVPVFRSFRLCFQALRAFADYQAARAKARVRKSLARPLSKAQQNALTTAGVLDASATRTLLSEAGIDLVQERLVHSAAEASEVAAEIGFPLVMKLASPAFPHKSDVGLVKLNVRSPAEVESLCAELPARARQLDPKAQIDGVLLQQQIGSGVEMIIGLSQDPQLGPALTVGAGGIYAEILRDVAVRPLPVDADDVREMIASLKLSPLLDGVRGAPPAAKEALVKAALAVAALGESAQSQLSELDLNPVIVLPNRAVAVDSLAVSAGASRS